MQVFTLIADLESSDRADKYLHEIFQENDDLVHLSRSQIQKLIDAGLILVSGKKITSKSKIIAGSEITVSIEPPSPLEVLPENIPIKILFEDEHLIVINKQPGLTVHPSDSQKSGTLVNALLYHVKNLSGIGGKLRPGIVHRIDKDTSGALVVSKDDLTHQGLSKLFSTHDIQRKYWALVYGSPKWETHTLKSTIGRNPTDRKKMAVNVEGGRQAISHFKKIQEFSLPQKNPFSSMIEATLQTGRTHQVRIHLNHLGNSILGDPVYGTPSDSQHKWKALPENVRQAVQNLPGQALHARILGFIHPITKKELYFEAEPFEAFEKTLLQLQNHQ